MLKIFILLCTAIIFYCLGIYTIENKIYPYNFIKYLFVAKTSNNHISDISHNYSYIISNILKSPNYIASKDLYEHAYLTKKVDYVMLGDSITYRANWNELFENISIANRGINTDVTEGFLLRLNHIVSLNPKKVFIMGGINDLSRDIDVNTVFNNFKKIITILQENGIEPIIQSTLYTTSPQYAIQITELNNFLADYSIHNNIKFINLNKVLSKNNLLCEEYTSDGVHLNHKGYLLWKNEIQDSF